MIKHKPYSATFLALEGVILSFLGLYFIFLRPPLLPEDIRYIGSSLQNIKENIPGLLNWLQKVFWVMGAYIFTTGLLILFISFSSFRSRLTGTFGVVLFAGISSIGAMTVVNFMIGSDFKWFILIFMILWAVTLILYRFHK